MRISHQYSDDQYQCSLENKSVSHRNIFDSLDIEEIAQPSNRMTLEYMKIIDGISCNKTTILGQKTQYKCTLLPTSLN